jgi:hypothetical protein
MSGKRRSSAIKKDLSTAAAEKLIKERLWVDQWAKELRGQKEWSRRWGSLNDPKMYSNGDEDVKKAAARTVVSILVCLHSFAETYKNIN